MIKNKIRLKIMNGKVKFFDEKKGFGFILEHGTDKEYFVHATGCIDTIKKDDVVEFEVTQGKKGMNAINVKLI
jgi:CspA family cold shock protein